MRRVRLAVPVALAAALAAVTEARAEGDVKQGRAVAERICKRCHVIGADNLHGGIGSTPSFFLMRDKLDEYRARILSVTDRRPHTAQDFELTITDLVNLIAYIGTLERP